MWHSLKTEEVEGTLKATRSLTRLPWAKPLLVQTQPIIDKLIVGQEDKTAYRANPVSEGERGFLFELRFAAMLASIGMPAEYEHKTGVGDSSVDFKLALDLPWLIELVSLRESQAVRKASWENNNFFGVLLYTHAEDPKQSQEGEILKAQQRIGAKVLDDHEIPIKFPQPTDAVHILIVDARGYALGKGDDWDWSHMTLGATHVPSHAVRFWTDPKTGKRAPITGLFEPCCPSKSSAVIRERIHMIGFICEEDFTEGEIEQKMVYTYNAPLINQNQKILSSIEASPFKLRK